MALKDLLDFVLTDLPWLVLGAMPIAFLAFLGHQAWWLAVFVVLPMTPFVLPLELVLIADFRNQVRRTGWLLRVAFGLTISAAALGGWVAGR